MTRLLAVESCGPRCSAALASEDEVVFALAHEVGRGHAEVVLGLAEEALSTAAWSWTSLDMIAVALGPGGFTGVRAGVAAARAWCLALDRPAHGVDAFEVLARSRPDLTGRRRAVFRSRAELLACAFAPDFTPIGAPETATDRALAALGDPLVTTDWEIARSLVSSGADARLGRLDAALVARAALARMARGVAPTPGTALQPIYARPPDARPGAGAPLHPALAARGTSADLPNPAARVV